MKIDEYDKMFLWNRNDLLYKAARDPDLSATAFRVVALFATFVSPGERETLRPSYEWIMGQIGLGNRRTLARALKNAESKGYLVIWRNQRMPSTYSMPFDGRGKWNPSRK